MAGKIYTVIGPDGKRYKGTRKEITKLVGVNFAIDEMLKPKNGRLQMLGWASIETTRTKKYKQRLKRNTFINIHTKEVVENRTFNCAYMAAKFGVSREVLGDVQQGLKLATKGIMLKCAYDIANNRSTQIDPEIY